MRTTIEGDILILCTPRSCDLSKSWDVLPRCLPVRDFEVSLNCCARGTERTARWAVCTPEMLNLVGLERVSHSR